MGEEVEENHQLEIIVIRISMIQSNERGNCANTQLIERDEPALVLHSGSC